MESTQNSYHCLNCNRSEADVPLVSLRHAGQAAWICSQCLPVLIHQPQQLAGKLAGADRIEPAAPHD